MSNALVPIATRIVDFYGDEIAGALVQLADAQKSIFPSVRFVII